MIRRLLASFVAVSAAATFAPITPATADPVVVPIDIEGEEFCTELVPHAFAVDAAPVRLDVRILLDGVKKRVARKAVASMRTAYEPLKISVRPSYERVSFKTDSAQGLNRTAKRHYGGERPRGIDIVYTLTSKDIAAGPPHENRVAGLADCIGGVRYDDRAFAVGEAYVASRSTLPIPVGEATGKTMAHEIGHLMGAHHHYASPEGLSAEDPNAFTMMGPSLSIISLKFSTHNSWVVQAHAQLYAD